MQKERILAVDDEEDILELLNYNLQKEGYAVELANAGELALKQARKSLPDLIVLDLMMPVIDGLEVCRRLKKDEKTAEIPIIILSAKGEEADIITGLELGADDYVTKPFSPKILVARIRTVLRRKNWTPKSEDDSYQIHDLVIHPKRHEILCGQQPVELTSTEFKILNFMARRPGWVFTRYQIVEAIRGPGYPVTDRSIDVQISGLRNKLGTCGDYIKTVRGVGYRFKD